MVDADIIIVFTEWFLQIEKKEIIVYLSHIMYRLEFTPVKSFVVLLENEDLSSTCGQMT